jgi:hypothetical protein
MGIDGYRCIYSFNAIRAECISALQDFFKNISSNFPNPKFRVICAIFFSWRAIRATCYWAFGPILQGLCPYISNLNFGLGKLLEIFLKKS